MKISLLHLHVPRPVGRGPVPRHAAIAGDRPPRYGNRNGSFLRRARACPSPCPDLVKDRSSGSPDSERVDGKKTARVTVGRGPVPRHRSHTPTIAGDRPPRYGNRNGSFLRRARACPSPCSDRGGNPLGCAYGIRAPALRLKTVPSSARLILNRSGAGAPELQR